MELNMLLVKVGVFLIYFMKPALLAKDSMKLSGFTFLWEDAEARCSRQGQLLAPGRRYRAKMIKNMMVKENVDAVWLNGWRAVSDIVPDADGKLNTLKVDFSRPQNKDLKMICRLDSVYYDPTYRAKSTEIARSKCKSDGAELADVTTEEDVKQITKDMLVDTPHWINSISSKGSKIKQCLVAKLSGDDLKYSYEDCSQEYHFICVEGDDIMSSFSPLISLKMARFEEFEVEIEKLSPTSAIFDLFSSSEIPLESSSIDVPMSLTSIFPSTMTPEITPSNQITSTPIQYTTSTATPIPNVQSVMTYADVTSSTQSQITSADVAPSGQPHMTPAGVSSTVQPELSPTDITSSVQVATITTDVISSVQTMDTYDDVSETETVVSTSSVSNSDVDSPLATYTILTTASYTDTITTMDKESSSESDIFSLTMLDKDPVTITSSVISTDVSTAMDVLQPSETTQDIVQITIDSVDNLSTLSLDVTDTQTPSINLNTEETMRVTVSSSQTVESSSIDTFYRENVFIEPKNSSVTIQFSSDMLIPMSTTVTSSSSKYSPLLTFVNTTGYYRSPTDTSINTDTELFVIQATQTVPSKLSSSSYFETFDTYEPENTTPTDRLDMGEVSTTHTTSSSVIQTPDIIIEPSSTLTVMPSTSDEDETDKVDEKIPGDLDKDDMDEDNAIGNASADKGEIVDEEEGTEIGLWIAFAILITLVLIALILAAFLYRKRKQQKSKDINTAAPPAAAGETVELRDSRSPSRENGKPRESATYKDPAYDI